MNALKKEKHDSFTKKNLIAALQKLSLRYQLQFQMINEGIADILLNLLEEHENLSDYSLEYGSVFFLNLTMKTELKKKFLVDYKRVMKLITNLLSGSSNVEVTQFFKNIKKVSP